jgi:prolipoprotein diacylglyceryltransferase
MIVIAGLVLGLLFGATLAKRRKGQTKDILQYAAAYAILFSIIGLFITIIIHRAAV